MYKFWSLRNHRVFDVRNEARATNLARAFIKNTPYEKVENKCLDTAYRSQYITPRVISMLKKYHPSLKDEQLVSEVKKWYGDT